MFIVSSCTVTNVLLDNFIVVAVIVIIFVIVIAIVGAAECPAAMPS